MALRTPSSNPPVFTLSLYANSSLTSSAVTGGDTRLRQRRDDLPPAFRLHISWSPRRGRSRKIRDGSSRSLALNGPRTWNELTR